MLRGLILIVIGLAIGSQYYNREFSSLHGPELGLAIAAVGLIIIGALSAAFSIPGGKPTEN